MLPPLHSVVAGWRHPLSVYTPELVSNPEGPNEWKYIQSTYAAFLYLSQVSNK